MTKTSQNIVNHSRATQLLMDGCVGVIPTDTQYGLVAAASNVTAVEKLYSTKKRDKKPGTIIAANIEQLVQLGIKRRYLTAVADFWPRPLSVVLPVGPELSYLDRGLHSLAVRIPKDDVLQKVLQKTGPLATTSANLPAEEPAGTIQEALKYFGDNVDFYVDGGDLSGRKPSTIIRVVDDAIEVLREGSVIIDEQGNIKN